MTLIHTIVTHRRPHFDEILAIWLFINFGQKFFPGVREAEIIFDGGGGEDFQGKNGDGWEKEGVLCIGVAGGRFDEHAGVHDNKKEGACAATLAAQALGIENHPELEGILRFASNSDLRASGSPFDLAEMIKALHQKHPSDPEKVIAWAMLALDAKHHQQKAFLEAEKELTDNTITEEIRGPRGKIVLMVANSDNEGFSKAARKNGAAIIIQRKSTGNVQIYTSKKFGLNLENVAYWLRIAELREKGIHFDGDRQDLTAEGKADEVPEWFFFKEGMMLLNGSLSCEAPPTQLDLDTICDIVARNIR